MAWYNRGYDPEWQWFHDLPVQIKGIVEFLAEMIGPDSSVAARLGVAIIIVVLALIIFSKGKIFHARRPTRFGEILNCIMKGRLDE